MNNSLDTAMIMNNFRKGNFEIIAIIIKGLLNKALKTNLISIRMKCHQKSLLERRPLSISKAKAGS